MPEQNKIFGWGFRLFAKDELSSKLKDAQNNVMAFNNQINGLVGTVKSAAQALFFFYATSRTIGQIRNLLYLGQGLEQTQLQLQSLTGSVKESRELFEFARRKAEELPFGSVQEITASIKTMNLFGFNAQRHFDTIAQLAAASGESLDGVVFNLNFFTQSGFGRGLARMGVNIKELQSATKGLRPGTDAFREATIRYLQGVDKFRNAISVQRNSISGLKDDIGDIKESFKLDILGLNTESGLVGGYKRFLKSIRAFLMDHKESLKVVAKAIGQVLGGIFDILGHAFTRMTKGFGNWLDRTAGFLKGNQNLIGQFIFWLALVELKIEGILSNAWRWVNRLVETFGGWKVVLAGLAAFTATAAVSTFGSSIFRLAQALGAANPTMLLLATAIGAWTAAIVGGRQVVKEFQGLSGDEKTIFFKELGKDFLGLASFGGFPSARTTGERIVPTAAELAAGVEKLRGINANINNNITISGVTPDTGRRIGREIGAGINESLDGLRRGEIPKGRVR